MDLIGKSPVVVAAAIYRNIYKDGSSSGSSSGSGSGSGIGAIDSSKDWSANAWFRWWDFI